MPTRRQAIIWTNDSLLTHICGSRHQWGNMFFFSRKTAVNRLSWEQFCHLCEPPDQCFPTLGRSLASGNELTPAMSMSWIAHVGRSVTWPSVAPPYLAHVWLTAVTTRIALTYLRRGKIAAISQMTFSTAFSWMKMYEFRLECCWSLFLGVELTIFQHWFR